VCLSAHPDVLGADWVARQGVHRSGILYRTRVRILPAIVAAPELAGRSSVVNLTGFGTPIEVL